MRRLLPLFVILASLLLFAWRAKWLQPFEAETDVASTATDYREKEPMPRTEREASETEAERPRTAHVIHGSVSPRSSFYEEMRKAGVSPANIIQMVGACRGVFNIRRVRPGQEYAVFRSPNSEIDSLILSINSDKLLKVRQRENNFHAVLDTVPYCVSYQLTSGVIEQSLFISLQAERADPELAASLSHIFGWEIDFFTDIRAGDDFTILYEKRRYEDGSEVLGSILAARITTSGEDHYAFGYKAKNRPWGYYDLRGASLEKSLLRAPLKYTRITSGFKRSRFHPVLRHYAPHLGVDYAAPYGTPVHATGDGTVVTAARNRTNGRYVKIRHNRTYTTYYLHLSRFAKGIRKGRKVKQGQVIGYVGSTGLATGPHLDYRIKRNDRFVNPRTIRLPSKAPVPDTETAFFNRVRDACIVRFCEGSCGQGEKAKTVSVEKPSYHDPAAVPGLF